MLSEYNFLTDIVKEQGITKIILGYKSKFEECDILDKYNNIWNLVSTYAPREHRLFNDFIVNNFNKLDLEYLLTYRQMDEELVNLYKYQFTYKNWETLLLRNNYSLDFVKKNYYKCENFFHFYLSDSYKKLPELTQDDINELVKIMGVNNYCPEDFLYNICKYYPLSNDFVNFLFGYDNKYLESFAPDNTVNIKNTLYHYNNDLLISYITQNKNFTVSGLFVNNSKKLLSNKGLWNIMLQNNTVPEDILDAHFEHFNSSMISKYQKISLKFVNNCLGFSLNRIRLCQNKKMVFSTNEIKEYFSIRHFNILLKNQIIDEKLYNFFDVKKIDWSSVATYQELSEDLIYKYKNYFNMTNIFKYQKLSDEFILDNYHKVNINIIIKNQKLSEDLLDYLKDVIDWDILIKHQELSRRSLWKYKKYINWFNAYNCQKNISLDMIIKYHDDIFC